MSNERKRFTASHTARYALEEDGSQPSATDRVSDETLTTYYLEGLRDPKNFIDKLRYPNNYAHHDLRAEVIARAITGAPGKGSETCADLYIHAYIKSRTKRNLAKENSVEELASTLQLIKRSRIIQRIETPPGSWMTSIAGVVYSKKTRERIFDPIIADFRHEYFEELHEGSPRGRMFFVHARHWCGFIAAVALQAMSSLAKVIGAYRSAGK